MSSRPLIVAITAGLGGLALASTGAAAIDGHSDAGDSYLNDAQKNPRFIEPYAGSDPARYRESNPQEGYRLRQQAAGGYYAAPYPGPYGRVEVRPYRIYRP